MAVEIEAKIKVAEHGSIRERLRAAGAEHVSDVFETNTFLDTAAGSLKTADEGLRLRQIKSLKGPRQMGTGQTTHVLTFKGPAQTGPLKQREEIETAVTDPEAMTAILSRLGYEARLTFEKKRQTWKLNHCLVELDEVPLLGLFVEVEGPDTASIESVRIALGLANEGLVKAGYSSLLAAELDRTNSASRVVRF